VDWYGIEFKANLYLYSALYKTDLSKHLHSNTRKHTQYLIVFDFTV